MRIVESPTTIGSLGFALSATGSAYDPTPSACGAGAPQPGQKRAESGIGCWQLGQVMGAGVRHGTGGAYMPALSAGTSAHMEREAIEEQAGRDQGRDRVRNSGIDDLGTDDQEFSSVEDTGAEPSESPAVDDV